MPSLSEIKTLKFRREALRNEMLEAAPHYPCQPVELALAIEIWLAEENEATLNLNKIFGWWGEIADRQVASRQRTIVTELFIITDQLWRLENPALAEVMKHEVAERWYRVQQLGVGNSEPSGLIYFSEINNGGVHERRP